MGQRPAELTPLASRRHFFGAELRYWRRLRGLSLSQLGRAVYVSADLIGKVEKAQRWPNVALVKRCETVLDSGGVLLRLYALAADERRTPQVQTDAAAPAGVQVATPIMMIVPVHETRELPTILYRAGAALPADVLGVELANDPAGAMRSAQTL